MICHKGYRLLADLEFSVESQIEKRKFIQNNSTKVYLAKFEKTLKRMNALCKFAKMSKDTGIIQVAFHIKADLFSRMNEFEKV